MPKYMDVHTVEGGVTADDVAALHAKDLEHAPAHGVTFLKYWLDEEKGKIFCLSEAPSAEAHMAVHEAAGGFDAIPQEIFEVSEHD